MRWSAYRGLPLLNVVLKRLGLERGLAQVAADIEVLQPEEREDIPPPISLKDQIELATGTTRHDTLPQQLALARQAYSIHAPVIRYTLENCVVSPSGVEFLAGSQRKYGLHLRNMVTRSLTETADAHYPMTPVSHEYFGHFLRDACATALLAQPEQTLLLDINSHWPHAADYASTFQLEPAAPLSRFVRRLTICVDHAQGSHKRARYNEMRRRIAHTYGPRGDAKETIYLRRGGGGTSRLLVDEEHVASTLSAWGYRIVTLDGATLPNLAAELRTARRVVTLEGSHINHVYFLAPSGVDLCVLMPTDRVTFIHRYLVHAFGGRFGYVICRKEGSHYRLDLDQLAHTMDLFEQ